MVSKREEVCVVSAQPYMGKYIYKQSHRQSHKARPHSLKEMVCLSISNAVHKQQSVKQRSYLLDMYVFNAAELTKAH